MGHAVGNGGGRVGKPVGPVHGLQVAVLEFQIGEMFRLKAGLGEDELQFVAVGLDEFCSRFRAHADPVDAVWHGHRAVRLYGDRKAASMQCIDQVLVDLEHGLPACQHDEGRAVACRAGGTAGARQIVGRREFAASGAVCPYEICIAEAALGRRAVGLPAGPQIAPREPAEHGGRAGIRTLALERIEDFLDLIHGPTRSSGTGTVKVSERVNPDPRAGETMRSYKYFDLVMVAFVVVLVCSNLIGPAKAAQIELPLIGAVTFGAGVLFFPISYIFGDILTEVYGYSRARRVIWTGFAALIFASLMAAVVVALPPAPTWENQKVYEIAFGNTWRIAGASMIAYFCGEFVNSYVLAKMKIATEGRYMRTRFVASTVAGEAVDSAIFYPLAFWNSGIMPNELVLTLVVSQFVTKTLVEVTFLPVTTRIVNALKKAEQEDVYDRDTDFNPFAVKG